MLVSLWSSPSIRAAFQVSFSYRDSPSYTEGLRRRVQADFPVHALRFADPSSIVPAPRAPRVLRRLVRFGSRLLFTIPLLIYETAVLFRFFHRAPPDLVHINNGGYPAALSARAAAIAARIAGLPCIMVVNNLATRYNEPLRWLEYPLDRLVARSVSHFVTGSRAAADRLKATLRLTESNCAAINNGITLRPPSETIFQTRERLGLASFDGIVFGIVAVMEPRKGHRILLEAMVELRRRHPGYFAMIRLVLEGDGPLKAELQRFATEHDLQQCCIFSARERNVMNLFAAIDVLVLPSVGYEDFPNVVLEAMGYARAVIASRLAGIPEQIVDGETGLLVTPGNSGELAAAMERFCADPALRVRLGRSGFERFRNRFTAEAAAGKYAALYNSLIEAQST